ncbi:MAG: SdrD B-like domain-containing protein [Sphingomicrobium sp.]
MRFRWQRGLNALALAALASAGAVGALGASASTDQWVADPDSQYLLDVDIRTTRLGQGVRAYQTPQGACVVLGDLIDALDLPLKVDVSAGTMQGWAIKEANKLAVDRGKSTARYGEKAEKLSATAIRDVPEGWCVDTAALGRWFGLSLTPKMSGSALSIESEAKLPVELAAERHRRAAQLKKNASVELGSLPQVKLPYRMWRRPAMDFVVSGGVTYRAETGARIDRRTAVYAAGEIAQLSYNAQVSTDDRGKPQVARFRAFRSDPDGGLLGPLNATNFEFGDVSGRSSKLLGAGASGRGFAVTNQPLYTPTTFDRTRFEGDLQPGWEAEIYRNGQLLGFASSNESQRYIFEDVQLVYGDNQIDIILYGPQGQIRTRTENVNVGQENVPPGSLWYWVGANQPGRDLVNFQRTADTPDRPKAQATAAVAYGIDKNTSVSLVVQSVQLEDERLTYVEGTIRRSIGRALVEVAAARDDKGGMATRAQLLTRLGDVSLSAEAIAGNDFRLNGLREAKYREARVSLDAPIKLGRTVVPVHGDVRYRDRGENGRQLEAAMRLSSHINRFNLSGEMRYRKQWTPGADPPSDELETSLLASGRIGDVRLRGSGTWNVLPQGEFRSAEVSAYWSASEKADFEAAAVYEASSGVARGRLSHVRRFDTMALAVTGEAATDGSVAVGFNLNFSLDPSSRGVRLSRQPLASAGAVRATVYRDLNDNGRRDAGEPFEKGAQVTTGPRLAERTTDANGSVLIPGLTNYVPVAVGIDSSTLADPTLAPRKALQVVTPRPGVAADVEIGLVGAGDIEGSIVRGDGEGFEGLDVELVDESGKVIATTRSDYDGFFLFERVAYGKYVIRLVAESAKIAQVERNLGVSAELSSDAPLARLGIVRVTPLQNIAENRTIMDVAPSALR